MTETGASSAKGKRKHDATQVVDDAEQWAPIGFHPNYEVSTHGNIRNVAKSPPTPIISHVNSTNGLHMKTFPGDITWVVAKLVLTVFRRPARENEKAIYLDKNASNLHLSNLVWSSGGNPKRQPAQTRTSRKVKVTAADGTSVVYASSNEVQAEIGIHYSAICKYVGEGSWNGYHFEYVLDNKVGNTRVRNLTDFYDCDGGRIFSDGRIEMPKGSINKASEDVPDAREYKRVAIVTKEKPKGDKVDIHRLVAMAFLPPPDFPNAEVDHINKCKWDNRVENLQYVTHQENMRRAHANGNITPPHQKRVRLYKFNADTGTYAFLKEYDNMTQAGKDNGCTQGAVKKICAKQRDALPKARVHARSIFSKTHTFRLSATDDLA